MPVTTQTTETTETTETTRPTAEDVQTAARRLREVRASLWHFDSQVRGRRGVDTMQLSLNRFSPSVSGDTLARIPQRANIGIAHVIREEMIEAIREILDQFDQWGIADRPVDPEEDGYPEDQPAPDLLQAAYETE